MNKLISLSAIVIIGFLVSCSAKVSETVIADLTSEKVMLNEFEKAYKRSANENDLVKDDSLVNYRNFLDLYSLYRMKLLDAKAKGYDKLPEVVSEIEKYTENVGSAYYVEKNITRPGVRDLYEKRKEEMRVSHIMFKKAGKSYDEVNELASKIIDSLKAGSDWNEMVKKYTQDFPSKEIGGDSYYFTAGFIAPEFEDAAYNTPVGTVYPKLVETKFGYHILKVTERQPRKYKLVGRHILIMKRDSSGKVNFDAAKLLADSLYGEIKKGAEFETLAKEHSEDVNTAPDGGFLGPFERSMMVRDFDEAAFKMKSGEISEPVKTRFGYHIIKIDRELPYPEFQKAEEEFKELFKRSRYESEYKKLIDSLKIKFNYKQNPAASAVFLSISDSVRLGDDYMASEFRNRYKDSTLFVLDGKVYTVDSLFVNSADKAEYRNKFLRKKLNELLFNNYVSETVLNRQALDLANEDEDFLSLMDEYKNGILIFKIMESEVWNKVKADSLEIHHYYEKNKEKYTWPDRVDYSEIYLTSDSLANALYDKLAAGADFDSLASQYTERVGYKEKKGRFEMVPTSLNKISKVAFEMNNPGQISRPIKDNRGVVLLKLHSKEKSRSKTFEEAKLEVSGDYQTYMTNKIEEEYVKSLNEKYRPVLYYDELQNAFKDNN